MTVMTTGRVLLAGATALAISVAGGLSQAGAATAWDLPLAWPDGNFHVANAKTFAEEVNKATGGEITINIHPGGSLGFKGPEMLKSLRDGLVPIGDYFLSQQVGEEPFFGLESMPFLATGYEDLQTLNKHWRPEIEKIAAEKWNQKILYMVPWPRQYVYTKVPAKAVDDLKGIKIRTYNRSTTDLFNSVGMTSVLLPWGEVVPALAAGTIDAVTTSASSGVDGKFWEFLKYMYPTSHVWGSNVVAVNLDAWNGLSDEQRAAIEEVAERLEPQFWQVSRQEDETKAKILTDNGVVMGEVTPAMLTEMQDRTAGMVDVFIKEVGGKSADVIGAYRKARGQ
ncbi:MAG: TRAP transporter substrate-binding protein [Minwuiales bacterium]|nr:TRAP transporter substrate-binding protein [Minwuiales bacterium]